MLWLIRTARPPNGAPDDQIGAANRITEMSVLAAAKLVKTGKTYSLGLTIDADTPAFPPRSLSLTVVQPNQQEGARPLHNTTYNDDIFSGWLGIGSQIDGLGHLGKTACTTTVTTRKIFLRSEV